MVRSEHNDGGRTAGAREAIGRQEEQATVRRWSRHSQPRLPTYRRAATAVGLAVDEMFSWRETNAELRRGGGAFGPIVRLILGCALLLLSLAASVRLLSGDGWDAAGGVWALLVEQVALLGGWAAQPLSLIRWVIETGSAHLGVMFAELTVLVISVSVAYFLFRPWVQKIQGGDYILFFVVLILSLGVGSKTWLIFNAFSERQLTNPALSHVVLVGDKLTFPMSPENVQRMGARIEDLGLVDCDDGAAEAAENRCGNARFLHGRYEKLIRAAPATPSSGGEFECGEFRIHVEVLAANIEEPVFAHLRYLRPADRFDAMKADVSMLRPASFLVGDASGNFIKQAIGGGVRHGAIVTKQFLRNVLRTRPEDPPPEAFCLAGANPAPIPIIAVVDQLPQSHVSQYHVVISTAHYNTKIEAGSNRRKPYHNAAFYYSFHKAEAINAWLKDEDGPFGPDDAARIHSGGGIEKILNAIQLWETTSRFSSGLLLMLAIILSFAVYMMSRLFVVGNEQALCVVRIFAWRKRDIMILVLTRFLMTFAIAGTIYLSLLFLAGGLVDRVLQGTYDLLPQDLGSPLLMVLLPLGITCLAGLPFVGVAITWWAGNARFPADRLKEVD